MPFDPFSDFDTRGYLRNHFGLKNLEAIKELEGIAFRDSLGDALEYLLRQEHLTYANVLETHRILFEAVYPWAGQDRLQTVPKKRISKAGIDFALPNAIERAIDYALGCGQQQEIIKAKPGVVMGYLAFGHPFLDGNGRTIMTLFTVLTQRAAFRINWSRTTKSSYLTSLTRELQQPDQGHLDAYLTPFVEDVIIEDLYKHLIGIRALNESLLQLE